MSTDGIQVGDVVVLLDDDEGNCVTDFEQYIGLAGEVMNVYSDYASDILVKFASDPNVTWYYNPNQLEVIGSVRN